MKRTVITTSPAATQALAQSLAPYLFPGSVIALTGDLGAGKTTFASGLAHGLGVKEHVISPTFNLMRGYHSGRMPLFHIDAYRLEDGNADIGLEEFIDDGGASIIEWPQYIKEFVPSTALWITIISLEDTKRSIEMETDEPRFFPFLASLQEGHQ